MWKEKHCVHGQTASPHQFLPMLQTHNMCVIIYYVLMQKIQELHCELLNEANLPKKQKFSHIQMLNYCWTWIPGIVLGVMIHHPPLRLLLKGVWGDLHPNKGSFCPSKNL